MNTTLYVFRTNEQAMSKGFDPDDENVALWSEIDDYTDGSWRALVICDEGMKVSETFMHPVFCRVGSTIRLENLIRREMQALYKELGVIA